MMPAMAGANQSERLRSRSQRRQAAMTVGGTRTMKYVLFLVKSENPASTPKSVESCHRPRSTNRAKNTIEARANREHVRSAITRQALHCTTGMRRNAAPAAAAVQKSNFLRSIQKSSVARLAADTAIIHKTEVLRSPNTPIDR